MARICFVIQHQRERESDVNSPSGTLTVVKLLLEHWGIEDELVVLCNKHYANLPILRQLQKAVDFRIDELPVSTVQDHRAHICYRQIVGVRAYIQRAKIALLSPLITIHALYTIWQYLTDNRFNVIFSHSGGYPNANLNLLATIAARLAHVEHNYLIIHNVPDPVFQRRLPFSVIQDRLIGMVATRILSVSAACAQSIQEIRYLGTNVGFIHNGIPTGAPVPEYPLPTPPWYNRSHPIPTIMFLGSLQRRKGLHILVEALTLLRQKEWQLIIYGTGNEAYVTKLKRMITERKLDKQVQFEGFHPEATQYLQWADLLVLPSIAYESFGMVILEAMSYAKPVICSDYGGMKEVVVNGETGFVVRSGDPQDLADHLSRLLADSQIAKRYGEEGRKRLYSTFGIERSVEKYKILATLT